MDPSGSAYIKNMRKKGLNDEEIRKKLATAGWEEAEITHAFTTLDDDTLPPPPPSKQPASSAQDNTNAHQPPVAVVQRYTTRGIEYGIMFLSLGIGAVSLGTVLHDLADTAIGASNSTYSGAPMASAAALVAIPIFLALFIR